MPARNERLIFIVSDGTCRTGQQVLDAARMQFEGENVRFEHKASVRTAEHAVEIVDEAAARHAIIFFTLVEDDTRNALRSAAHEHLVHAVDILGPVLAALDSFLTSSPQMTPGLLYEAHKEYLDRVDAIDYTLKHDDGKRAHGLRKAHVILVGVSRVSKSSTCFYLAYRGIRAANVPLFADQELPPELLDIDRHVVIGLTSSVHRLQAVRQARIASMGAESIDEYVDRRAIARELRAANALMDEHKWHKIDVSYKAIEEVAREVMRLRRDDGADI